MKTIVFIGTQKSGSSREAIRAADRLGYYTVLFTDRPTILKQRTEFPDVHLVHLCDLNDIEEIKNGLKHLAVRALDVYAIVSFVDPYCHTAALLSEEFGLNHFSTEAIGIMQDKVRSRQALSNTPHCPRFISLSKDSFITKDEIEELLPVIIKSPNSSGSKDVFKINTFREFVNCRSNLLAKYPDAPVLVEEFLDGPQYLVETVVYKSRIHIIGIIKQEISFCNGHFIVTGYNLIMYPQRDFYNKLLLAVESILESHGMKSGPCHLEMRYVKDQWKLIEVNPRISGGGMNQLLEAGYGINLVEETLKISLGQEPDFEPKFKRHSFAQYVVVSRAGTLQKITGRNRAYRFPGVKFVYLKPRKGTSLIPPLSMGNRYAFIIANGDTEIEAIENAKLAASQIQFWLLINSEDGKEELTVIESYNDIDLSDKYLERYRNYLIKNRKSETTADHYVRAVNKYIQWLNSTTARSIPLKRELILDFKHYLVNEKRLKQSTLNKILRALINFNTFLILQGLQKDTVIDKKDLPIN